MRRVGCFEWSIHFWVHILGLVTPMDFILHIFIILNGLNNLAMICIMRDHSKITKNAFLDDPNSQKRGFLDLGLMDRLDIAYDKRNICFPTFGNTTRSWRIIQKSPGSIFEWSKLPKRGFHGLGVVDRLDISYYDKTKCFPTFSRPVVWSFLFSYLRHLISGFEHLESWKTEVEQVAPATLTVLVG